MSTDTPRTDAHVRELGPVIAGVYVGSNVHPDFARQLERELTAALSQVAALAALTASNRALVECSHAKAEEIGASREEIGNISLRWCPQCGALKRTMTNWKYTDHPWQSPTLHAPAGEDNVKLLTYDESELACANGNETPLQRFIYEHQPIYETDLWHKRLRAAITHVIKKQPRPLLDDEKNRKRVAYWKYRLTHERCAHRTTKKVARETVNNLLRRLMKAERVVARLHEYVYNLPSCF